MAHQYGRPVDPVVHWTLGERLRDLGLKLLYIGPESGDDVTLKRIAKGANSADHVEAAARARQAGMKQSLIFLLGARFLEDMSSTYEGYDKIIPWSVNAAGWGVFVAMIAIALALGRNWTKFTWLAAAGAIFFLFWIWLGKAEVAVMAAFGSVLLFGGFFTCLRIALKGKEARAKPEA